MKPAAALLLKVTAVAPERFVPVTTTAVPATPEAGAKLEIVGVAGGGGSFEAALPQPAIVTSRVAETRATAHRVLRLAPPNLLEILGNRRPDAKVSSRFSIPLLLAGNEIATRVREY